LKAAKKSQIINDKPTALVVAGSGGTALDDVKTCNPDSSVKINTLDDKEIFVPYSSMNFGITLFKVTADSITIDYYTNQIVKGKDNIEKKFNVIVYKNRSIITETINKKLTS
jgi:hypothetical protein